MKISNLLITFLVLTFMFCSCNQTSDKELTGIIPADTNYVIYLNTKSLANKSELDIFKNQKVKGAIEMAKGFLVNKNAEKTLEDFTKNINSVGLNLKGNTYIFSDMLSFGVVMEVNDSKRIKQVLLDLSIVSDEEQIKFNNGIYSYSPNEEYGPIVLWDNKKMLMYGKIDYRYSEEETIADVALKLFTQTEAESINSKPQFAEFLANKSDISILGTSMSFDKLEQLTGNAFPSTLRALYSQFLGAGSVSHISFEKGSIKLNSTPFFVDAESEKKYTDLLNELMKTVNTQAMAYIPEDAILTLASSVDGVNLYEFLQKNNIFSLIGEERSEEDLAIIKSVMYSTMGDVSFSINDMKRITKTESYGEGDDRYEYQYKNEIPVFSAFSEQKNGEELLKLLIDKLPVKLTEVDKNIYSLEIDDVLIYLGLKDKQLFVTNDQKVFDNLQKGVTNSYYSKYGNDKIMIMGGNFVKLKAFLEEISTDNNQQEIMMQNFLKMFSSYELTMTRDFRGAGALNLENSSKNSLAVIADMVEESINQIGF